MNKVEGLNILTFDVEEWYQANYPRIKVEQDNLEDEFLEKNVQKILDLCRLFQVKATFFILGLTAEKYPNLVPLIKNSGHEIACHGYRHCLIYKLTPLEFENELKKALTILERQTGEKIIGFRAPSWSVTKEMTWFFRLLKNYNFLYDSSLFPFKTFLYGEKNLEAKPFWMEGLLELPPSTLTFFRFKIPFSGGFYFRVMPYWLIKKGIKKLNSQGIPAIVYLHPREIDPQSPRLPFPLKERIIHYAGLKETLTKLKKLLKNFRFTSIKEYFQLRSFDK
ncbi:MAG: polysaccharide deacetylase family protein [Candidatus Aminicenantes bacterium]|nr:polysaccharide deacetylase family protein [Candidatus Aminicenantes bacterium]